MYPRASAASVCIFYGHSIFERQCLKSLRGNRDSDVTLAIDLASLAFL